LSTKVSSQAYDIPLDVDYEIIQQNSDLLIQGKTLPFLNVYIDGKSVDVAENGSFSKQLSNYNNTVSIIVRDVFGKNVTEYLDLGLEEITEEVETEEITYETIKKEDPDLDKGEEIVDQEGVTGEKVITYEVTYFKGEEIGREAIGEEITVKPVDEIIRVGTKITEIKEEKKTQEIPYETIKEEDPDLDKGEEVVDQEGVTGEKVITYEVTYVNGEEIDREIASEEVTTEPIDEIIRVGTKVTEVKEEQKTEEIPYETKEKEDPTLDKGEKVVDQAGVAGEKTITYNVTYVNGEEVDREFFSEEVTVEPVEEIIRVGTKVTEVKEEQKTEEIPYKTKEKEDPTLDKGKKVVDQVGVVGEKTVIYKVTYVNGEETEREAISEEVIEDPTDEVIRVGTKDVIEVKEEEETGEIPYETIKEEDPDLEKGKVVVDQDGVVGEKVITYEV